MPDLGLEFGAQRVNHWRFRHDGASSEVFFTDATFGERLTSWCVPGNLAPTPTPNRTCSRVGGQRAASIQERFSIRPPQNRS